MNHVIIFFTEPVECLGYDGVRLDSLNVAILARTVSMTALQQLTVKER